MIYPFQGLSSVEFHIGILGGLSRSRFYIFLRFNRIKVAF